MVLRVIRKTVYDEEQTKQEEHKKNLFKITAKMKIAKRFRLVELIVVLF